MSWGLAIIGMKAVKSLIKAEVKRDQDAIAYALFNMAQDVLDKSLYLVPVELGNLRRSGYVAAPKIKGKEVVVDVGYNTDYAVYVHEIPPPPQKSPKGRSATHIPPTQWKYLSDPYDFYLLDAGKNFQKYMNKFKEKNEPRPRRPRKGEGRK